MTSPTAADAAPVILDQVSVSIGGRPILRDVDLTVRAGDMVTLLGPNGSGKSTLVRAVTGLLPHTRGTVRLFGTPKIGRAHV